MRIPARYKGRCRACGSSFAAGTMVWWTKRPGSKRGSATCSPCHDRHEQAKAAPRQTPEGLPRWNEHVVRMLGSPVDLVPEIAEEHRRRDTATEGQESFADAVSRFRDGDTRPAILAAIERGREEGRALGQPLAARMAMVLDFCGAVPSVPHYLAGCDRTMRRPASEPSESAPLRVYISAGLNWSVRESEALERGGRIAGLVDAISAARPVELWGYLASQSRDPEGGHVALTWPIDTRDTPRMVPNFGQTACRGIIMRWLYGQFPTEPTHRGVIGPNTSAARAHLGLRPDDIMTDSFCRAGDDGDVQGIIRAIESRLPAES